MLQDSSKFSSMFSCLQKDFCFFCNSLRTHLGHGTAFTLHSEWKTAPQLSHLQTQTSVKIESQNRTRGCKVGCGSRYSLTPVWELKEPYASLEWCCKRHWYGHTSAGVKLRSIKINLLEFILQLLRICPSTSASDKFIEGLILIFLWTSIQVYHWKDINFVLRKASLALFGNEEWLYYSNKVHFSRFCDLQQPWYNIFLIEAPGVSYSEKSKNGQLQQQEKLSFQK